MQLFFERDLEIGSGFSQEVLGRGSFGRVVKGTIKRTGAPVAVKMFDLSNEQMNGVIGDIHNEADLMSQLDHPNLVSFIGYMAQPHVALVLELMQCDLFAWLHKKSAGGFLQPLSEDRQLQFMIDIAGGLAYLHAAKMWHRDLKSPNVLLDGELRCKLADFGFAKNQSDSGSFVGSVTPASKSIGQIGTDHYNAPEVIGLQPYNEAGDLYALGVLCWEICTRQVPWGKLSSQEIKEAVLDRRERLPGIASLPRLYSGIVDQLTSWDPCKRPRVEIVLAVLLSTKHDPVSLDGADPTITEESSEAGALRRADSSHEAIRRRNDPRGFHPLISSSSGALDLSNKQVEEVECWVIADALKINSTVTSLNLCSNLINDEGAKALAEALKVNATLTTLNLGGNRITEEGAKAVAEALKINKTLVTLYLSWNQINEEGCMAIAAALKVNASIATLDLSCNKIDGATKQALKSAFGLRGKLYI